MHDHGQAVEQLAEEVADFYERKRAFRIYHGSTNSTRILKFKRDEMVDVSQLNHVLSVNVKAKTAWVEPNVPMDQLVAETLKFGLVPPVVMEFPGITVGGGVQGGAGESSSFRYGCFNQICNKYEMVLANGDIVDVSPRQRSDLFYGTAGSFGTLGIITAAEVQLVPATKYVQLTYLPVASFAEAVTVLKRTVKEKCDFIDGIMFSATNGVIIVGKRSNAKIGKVVRFNRAHDEWYYLHTQKISEKRWEVTETVPLVDYCFRYDRGAFWVGRFGFAAMHMPFIRFTRWLFNPVFHTRKLYEALQASGASQQHLIQDIALPHDAAETFMEFVDKRLGIYPLWLCPFKTDERSPFQSNNLTTNLGINVGVWGDAITPRAAFLKANRDLERTVVKLGGKKWFYAHSYYTEREFWQRYDKAAYDTLRRKYHATSLPDIYEKIRVREQYEIHIKHGAWRTLLGLAKLRVD